VRIYLSDCARLGELTDWRPRRTPRKVLEDTLAWVENNERAVRATLA
jgi:nucleoside-diphosphate-sugar epimerase